MADKTMVEVVEDSCDMLNEVLNSFETLETQVIINSLKGILEEMSASVAPKISLQFSPRKAVSVLFAGIPEKEKRNKLMDLGFRYDPKTRTWTATHGVPRKDGEKPADADKALKYAESLIA